MSSLGINYLQLFYAIFIGVISGYFTFIISKRYRLKLFVKAVNEKHISPEASYNKYWGEKSINIFKIFSSIIGIFVMFMVYKIIS